MSEPKQEDAERNFPEDFHHENGNYSTRCFTCGQMFLGHKRRVICKACQKQSDPDADALNHTIKELRRDLAAAQLVIYRRTEDRQRMLTMLRLCSDYFLADPNDARKAAMAANVNFCIYRVEKGQP